MILKQKILLAFILAYCDATLNGKAVAFKSVNDPYVRYQVRKYGISNTIGLWKKGKHPGSITDKEIVDAEVKMNCRKTWGSYVPLKSPPPDNKYVLGTKQDGGYFYYRKKLIQWKNNYYKQKRWGLVDE